MTPQPYRIHVPDAAIADLRDRLARTRWPGEIEGSGWGYGANLAYLRELCDYWRDGFDWRAQEARLNAMPQFTTDFDGYALHYVEQQGVGPDPLPLLFSHGWPGSIFEVSKIIGPLTDPAAHGGDPADAFTVVAPSLPGYGFSQVPTTPGFGAPNHTADLWADLMARLGYDRYGAQGGDWGAGISASIAHRHAEHVVGAHLNMVAVSPPPGERDPRSPEEEAYLAAARAWDRAEAGYQKIQGTKPQTLAYGLTDSPRRPRRLDRGEVAQLERLRRRCRAPLQQGRDPHQRLHLLVHRHDQHQHASLLRRHARPGRGLERAHRDALGLRDLPAEIAGARPPRSWVERGGNVVHWSEFDRGGHFASLEEPELLVGDVRDFFRPLR